MDRRRSSAFLASLAFALRRRHVCDYREPCECCLDDVEPRLQAVSSRGPAVDELFRSLAVLFAKELHDDLPYLPRRCIQHAEGKEFPERRTAHGCGIVESRRANESKPDQGDTKWPTASREAIRRSASLRRRSRRAAPLLH